jgi:hypothetical protein
MRTAQHRAARRATTSAVRYVQLNQIHRQVAELVRTRWPSLEADFVYWRVLERLARALEEGCQPAILPDWVRDVTYEVAATDMRADRGVADHQAELSTLLQELAQPQPTRLRPDLARRSVAQLHHRDWAVLRLVLAGHQRTAVAARTGMSPAQVDSAYSRARARLRAVVARDASLREALSHAAREPAGPRVGWSRPARAARRGPGLRSTRSSGLPGGKSSQDGFR